MALIIYSGGLDSTVLLYKLASEGRAAGALSINYGQKHVKELEFARFNAEKLGVPFQTLDLGCLAPLLGDNSLTSSTAVPDGDYDDENMKSTVVPFRNGIMLAVACGLAESYGLKRVMLANHFGDHAIYPDCRKAFVDAMSEAMRAGTYDGITVFAPYTGITKTDIARHGKELGLNYAETYSCYKGGEKHCGKCGTCRERIEALRDAGIPDPTEYEE